MAVQASICLLIIGCANHPKHQLAKPDATKIALESDAADTHRPSISNDIADSTKSPDGSYEPLSEALAAAYSNNSKLNAARAGVRVTDEDVAIAKSGYRPTIQALAEAEYSAIGGQRTGAGSLVVEIRQPIFDGFQTRNSVAASIETVRASNESLRNTEQNTLLKAATAYMNVVRDRQIAELFERDLRFQNEQVRASRARLEQSEGTVTDLAQAQAAKSAAIAQLAQARSQMLASEAVYREVVGASPGKLRTPGSTLPRLPRELDEALAIALKEHPAILARLHSVDAAAFSVKSVEGKLLPQLTASAGYAPRFSYGDSVNALNEPGWNSETVNSAEIGATLSVPLYQGGRIAAQVRQSKEALGQSRIEVDVVRDQVRVDLVSAWSRYISSRDEISANRKFVSASKLALEGVIEEQKVGQRTRLDVLNAQSELVNAQINLAQAEHDHVVATYATLSAMGRLSARQLRLGVEHYDPGSHYRAIKDKWYGLSTPNET